MDLQDVADEIAGRLNTIAGLRVFNHPPENVTAPAAIVTPGVITYDATYGRGMDRMEPGVVVLVGKATHRSAYRLLADYARGSGARSFKHVLETGSEYETCDTVRVVSADFDIITMAGVEYLSATFTLDVTGQGA